MLHHFVPVPRRNLGSRSGKYQSEFMQRLGKTLRATIARSRSLQGAKDTTEVLALHKIEFLVLLAVKLAFASQTRKLRRFKALG
jgi:hypothetical protein